MVLSKVVGAAMGMLSGRGLTLCILTAVDLIVSMF